MIQIFTASPSRTKKRLADAGLDPSKYEIGPVPSMWNDSNLDELIRNELGEAYFDFVRRKQFEQGCRSCDGERVRF